MKLVGHRNIKTTMIYTHLLIEDLREGAELITLPTKMLE
jgi:site-specific recombinase XerD